jgi:predicted helicase
MTENKATIYYHDIGDYLDRDKKLKIIKEYGSVKNPKMEWTIITPNEKHD